MESKVFDLIDEQMNPQNGSFYEQLEIRFDGEKTITINQGEDMLFISYDQMVKLRELFNTL